MPLELRPLEESDCEAYVHVCNEAFTINNGIMNLTFPKGIPDEANEWLVHKTKMNLGKRDKGVYMWKVIDTDLSDQAPYNKIVGVSDWNFHERERTPDEVAAEEADEARQMEAETFPTGCNIEAMVEFQATSKEERKRVLGTKPYVLLHVLATLPEHHRRGVGAMHLRWGLDRADELGIPAYLESSKMAAALYGRVGFETVKTLPFDWTKYSRDKDFTHVCMLRPVKTNSNV